MRAVLAASMLVIAPLAAPAAPVNYTADEIVDLLASSVNLGAERGICIGTVAECAAQDPATALAFDLMVNFELDSATLSESAKANLLEFSKALSDPRLASVSFSIEGHTDATGPESYNLRLSERRADAVVNFLREQGADTSRFVVKGFGESKPRTEDPFDPVNRRVETRIIE